MSLEQDDKLIKSLSKKLGLHKNSKKDEKSFKNFLKTDGLDDLFDFVDKIETNFELETRKHSHDSHKLSETSTISSPTPLIVSPIATKLKKRKSHKISADALLNDNNTIKRVKKSIDKKQDEAVVKINQQSHEFHVKEKDNERDQPQKYIPPHLRKKMLNQFPTGELTVANDGDDDNNDDDVIDDDASKCPSFHQKQLKLSSPTETFKNLKRKINGLINRLTEKNILSCQKQLSQIFKDNSRGLTRLAIIETMFNYTVYDKSRANKRLIDDFCMLIFVLHAEFGNSFTSYLVEELVHQIFTNFDLQHGQQSQPSCMTQDRTGIKNSFPNYQINNCLNFLSVLYNFNIIQVKLIEDVANNIIKTCESVNSSTIEKGLELLLQILTSTGYELRKRNAVTCKDLLARAQKLAASCSLRQEVREGDAAKTETNYLTQRSKFLIETISLIKNNNFNKIGPAGATTFEDTKILEHKKKLLKTITKQINSSYQPFPDVRVENLLAADKQGRFWLVSGVWYGSSCPGVVDQTTTNLQQQDNARQDAPGNETGNLNSTSKEAKKLQKLYKKYQINTNYRKDIFKILATSENMLDCVEQLRLLDQSQKQMPKVASSQEILHVCIHLFNREKKINNFYLHVISNLCRGGPNCRTFSISLKTAVWDRVQIYLDENVTTLSESKKVEMARFTEFLYHMTFTDQNLTFSIFKNLNFLELNKSTEFILKSYLTKISNNENSILLTSVISKTKLGKSKDVKTLLNSIAMFIDFFMVANIDNDMKNDKVESKKFDKKLQVLALALKTFQHDDGVVF